MKKALNRDINIIRVNEMKYVVAIIALLIGYKYVANNPEIMAMLTDNKELIAALIITIASRPFLKRIFD